MSEKKLTKNNYFKIDPECHLIGDMEHLNHFPGVQMWWRAIEHIMRPLVTGAPMPLMLKALEGLEEWEAQKSSDPQTIINTMDKYGVDIACLLPESMMDTTGFSGRWVSNGEMAKVVETNPERFMYQPNISPIKQRGVKNAIWELEYWVKEKRAKIFKYYPPEDTYINDPDLWPFYEKARSMASYWICTPASAGFRRARASIATPRRSTMWRATSLVLSSMPSTWDIPTVMSSTWWRWDIPMSISA